jgi:hypothetical protein
VDRKRKSVVGQASKLCAVRACEERAREVVRGGWGRTACCDWLVLPFGSLYSAFSPAASALEVSRRPIRRFSPPSTSHQQPAQTPVPVLRSSSAASQTKTMSLETRRDELTTAADACEADNERLRVEVLKAGPFPEGRSICLTDSAMLHSYTQRSRNWTKRRARRRTTLCGCVAFVHFRDLC